MQTDSQHVHAEPGKARDDIAKYRQVHDAALAHNAAPAGVEDEGVPDDDEQRAVLFGIPTPKSAPGLIGPDAAQDGASEAEQGGKANNSIDHFCQSLAD